MTRYLLTSLGAEAVHLLPVDVRRDLDSGNTGLGWEPQRVYLLCLVECLNDHVR